MSAYPGTKAWYISSAKYASVTAWSNNGGAGVARSVGDIIRQSAAPSRGNERCFICIVAGTGGTGAEPTWTLTRGAKTTDGSVTWMEATGLPPFNGDMTNCPLSSDARSKAIALGHVVTDGSNHIFICTTAGTSGGSDPSWNTGAVGNTTADGVGTLVWTYMGTSFGAWASPHARIDASNAETWGGSATGGQTEAGRDFFVGSDHAETGSANFTIVQQNVGGKDGTSPARIICVNVAGSLPPVEADLRTTATVTNTGSTSLSLAGIFRMYGITFICTTSGNVDAIDTNNDGRVKVYEQCSFQYGSGAGNSSVLAGSSEASQTEWIDCTIKFTGTGQRFRPGGKLIWRGGGIAAGSSNPTKFILNDTTHNGDVVLRNLDLSILSGSTIIDPGSSNKVFSVTLEDCKLPASYTFLTTANLSNANERFRMVRCGSAGNIRDNQVVDIFGAQTVDQTVARADGSNTDYAWKLTTTTLGSVSQPFASLPFSKYNTTLDPSSAVVTVYGIINAAAVPKDNECWIDVSYYGDASTPQGSRKTSAPSFIPSNTGTALTADSTSAWDAGASARVNSHTYSVGDTIKLASNPGRLFFCTTGGAASGSEPGGYASAVDGGSVTDGAAVFRAGCRFKMAVTLTSPKVQLAGPIRAQAYNGKASTTVYVDPFLDLS